VAGGDRRRLKLAALCQFTLPHPPIIYYGTEVGLSQRRDLTYPDGSRRLEESRTLMPWGAAQDGDLLAYFRTLVAMRRARPTLWQGERTTLAADRDHLLVGLADGRGRGLIAINRSSSPYRFDVPVGLSLAIATESRDVGADGSMTLSAMSGVVLVS
jgi:glycosidase